MKLYPEAVVPWPASGVPLQDSSDRLPGSQSALFYFPFSRLPAQSPAFHTGFYFPVTA